MFPLEGIMKKISIVGLLALLAALITVSCSSAPESIVSEKPVILVAAFGSSYETGQKNLDDFDKAVRAAFPDNEVYWGFTASFIVDKLRKQGNTTMFSSEVPLLKIDEAFVWLKDQGYKDVLTVNFLIMPGEEYREVMKTPTNGLNVKYVHSALYYPENLQNSILALEDEIADSDDTATIFCAHGNEKHLQYNGELEQINDYLQLNYKNTYLVTMEGTPEWPPVREAVLSSGVSIIKFITFMLTFGDHMSNDVMGDEEDSLKSQLGLEATVTDGLASMPDFQNMYIQKMRSQMAQFQGA